MKESKRTLVIDFLIKPVAVGLFVAAVLILVVPELRPGKTAQATDSMA